LQNADMRELIMSRRVRSSINCFIKKCLQLQPYQTSTHVWKRFSSLCWLDTAIASPIKEQTRHQTGRQDVPDNILIKNVE
jgi:hypothetical protein